jgi:hypothetical protein
LISLCNKQEHMQGGYAGERGAELELVVSDKPHAPGWKAPLKQEDQRLDVVPELGFAASASSLPG